MLLSVGVFTAHSLCLLLLADNGATANTNAGGGAEAGARLFEPLTISFFFGIILLLICIGLLMSPRGDKLAGSQRIQLGPLNLEVSILTLLVLVSVGLMSIGFWFRLQDISNSIKKADEARLSALNRAEKAEEDLDKERKTTAVAFVTLSGVADAVVLIPDLDCKFVTTSDEIKDEKNVHITPGDIPKRIKLTFFDIPKDASIKRVVIKNLKTGDEWETEGDFDLLRPRVRLTRSETTAEPADR